MKASWRAVDRSEEVLGAARAWRAAGVLDDAALAALAAEHPESGPRFGAAWRALIFFCVAVGVSASTVLGFFTFGVRGAAGVATILLLAGIALAIATDVVIDRLAFRPSGAEAAASLLATGYLAAAAFVAGDALHLRGHAAAGVGLAWGAAVFALAAWRWGFRLYAGAAVVCALLLAAELPAPRLAWIAAAAALAAGAGATLARRDFAPSHRDGLLLAQLVALGGLYAAVNYYSVDQRLIEEFGRHAGAPHGRAGDFARLLAGAATALAPPALLAWGLRARQRPLIDLGIAAAALSLVTLRFYVHVAPLWVVLTASGTALVGASLLIERWLKAGRGGERRGFTTAPLYDAARRERLLPVAAAIALAPAAGPLPEHPRGVDSGGGGFGGGGAGGAY